MSSGFRVTDIKRNISRKLIYNKVHKEETNAKNLFLYKDEVLAVILSFIICVILRMIFGRDFFCLIFGNCKTGESVKLIKKYDNSLGILFFKIVVLNIKVFITLSFVTRIRWGKVYGISLMVYNLWKIESYIIYQMDVCNSLKNTWVNMNIIIIDNIVMVFMLMTIFRMQYVFEGYVKEKNTLLAIVKLLIINVRIFLICTGISAFYICIFIIIKML